MSVDSAEQVEVPEELIAAIRALPARRAISHCGQEFEVPIFDIYAACPACGQEIKVRSFAAGAEIEDLFDAVFEWLANPEVQSIAAERTRQILEDQ